MMVVNKQRNFEETKRTPHYGLRKLNVGVSSVLLGVTVFGITVALDPAKAAANATETVTQPVTQPGKQAVTKPKGNVTTTGSGQNPASVEENNINTQTQEKNNQLAK